MALVLVVGAFLYFENKDSDRADLVADQRIQACHAVQADGTEALRELAESLDSQADRFSDLESALRDLTVSLTETLSDHDRRLDRLLTALERDRLPYFRESPPLERAP